MKAWLGDALRTMTAPWYWNTRKTVFVLRGRRGQCPCHHPSDSGRPGETGCEAVTGWNDPARFRQRVCPLLGRGADGAWRCTAAPDAVRPFWGRSFLLQGGLAAGAALLGGVMAFVVMRGIGYQVTPAQIFWPPRWGEFRELRVQLFTDRAREHYAAGRMREAMAALVTAYTLDPNNYDNAMLLGQVYQLASPESADTLYRRLMLVHPERRSETARVWMRSALARGNLDKVAVLALQEMREGKGSPGPWLHALLVAVRARQAWDWVETVLGEGRLPVSVTRILQLELAVRRAATPEEAKQLLRNAPWDTELAYARMHRMELLLEHGLAADALTMAASSRFVLGGRDVARFGLAARAALGQRVALRADVAALLSEEKALSLAEVSLLAQHLIRYPDAEFLDALGGAMPRLQAASTAERLEAWVNYYCAAGAAQHRAHQAAAREGLLGVGVLNPAAVERLEGFFNGPPGQQRLEVVLPQLQAFSLDLTYAMIHRYAWR